MKKAEGIDKKMTTDKQRKKRKSVVQEEIQKSTSYHGRKKKKKNKEIDIKYVALISSIIFTPGLHRMFKFFFARVHFFPSGRGLHQTLDSWLSGLTAIVIKKQHPIHPQYCPVVRTLVEDGTEYSQVRDRK